MAIVPFIRMPQDTPQPSDAALAQRLAVLEERVARIESQFAQTAGGPVAGAARERSPLQAATGTAAKATPGGEDEFEFEVGQNWFAIAGILALALGAGFMLSQPYSRLPAFVPSLIGALVAGGLFLLARLWQRTFELVASYLRGAGMALLYFATLRLYFFGTQTLLDIDSMVGRAPLVLVVAINLAIGLRRKSPWLAGLALLTGYATAIAVGAAWFVLGSVGLLSAIMAVISLRARWPRLGLAGIPLGYATYLIWAMGNPIRGGSYHFVTEPAVAPALVLGMTMIFGAASLLRPNRGTEDPVTCLSALTNCGLGYLLYLVHTAVAFSSHLTVTHGLASVVYLGLAVMFWVRESSRVSTFFYAMTGYAALSLAIMKASVVPEVFVWLSLQSIIVVATAVWFRSRFIVVANFLIYVAIILGYVIVTRTESGISLGFGLVALVSARILNWKKDRLELKTELMRNAYLVGAFLVFPYALYHLVSDKHVGLAWVGLALVYYVLNLVVQNRKYRWMGHATLLLTTTYLVIVGTRRFEPFYRIASFLVLGTVLLLVSLSFTRWRARQRAKRPAEPSMEN